MIARSESTSSHTERVSLYFRCLGKDCEEKEYATETVKIWLYGFLMRSHKELAAGTRLSLRLRVPTEISGSAFSEMSSVGRVVCEHELEDGSVAYRVELERAVSGVAVVELAQ